MAQQGSIWHRAKMRPEFHSYWLCFSWDTTYFIFKGNKLPLIWNNYSSYLCLEYKVSIHNHLALNFYVIWHLWKMLRHVRCRTYFHNTD
jgi:hypothetical protein